MPNLIIVIPFAPIESCDLDVSAAELQNFFNSIKNHFVGANVGVKIDNINIVYWDTDYDCAAGDYVILFAHGGKDDTDLSNNKGETTSMSEAIEKLESINAERAARVLFMCCFSGLEGHIGPTWKASNDRQSVFGGSDVISNFCKTTRSQIWGICSALSAL